MSKSKLPKKGTYRVLVLPDIHIPFEDKRTIEVVEKYMADHTWDEVVYLGDLLDMDMLSSFNKDALRNLEGRRIQEDYKLAAEMLDRQMAIVRKRKKSARFTYLEGNHEERVQRLLDKAPQFTGLVEIPEQLELEERGVKWIPSWSEGEPHQIGNAYFIHGKYTNKYHAAKHVDQFGVNIIYGHTHDVMSMPKVTWGNDKTLEGHSLGCLCLPQKYMKGAPTNWTQAFGVMYFQPDGYYNLYVVRIFDHKFISPEGKLYK